MTSYRCDNDDDRDRRRCPFTNVARADVVVECPGCVSVGSEQPPMGMVTGGAFLAEWEVCIGGDEGLENGR
jgi:hypothetical protein